MRGGHVGCVSNTPSPATPQLKEPEEVRGRRGWEKRRAVGGGGEGRGKEKGNVCAHSNHQDIKAILTRNRTICIDSILFKFIRGTTCTSTLNEMFDSTTS